MEKEIISKFSRIYKVVNIMFWLYIIFFVILIIAFIIFSDFNSFNFKEMIIEEMQESAFKDIILEGTEDFTKKGYFMFLVIIFSGILAFLTVFVNIYLLYILKKLCFNLKSGKIFTLENKKTIRNIFIIFTIVFTLIGLIFSGGILSIIALFFMGILYNIFLIGFDYKLKNEKLEEENNLTI